MRIADLKIGNVYSHSDIVDAFQCGNMGGMRRSNKTNTLVLKCLLAIIQKGCIMICGMERYSTILEWEKLEIKNFRLCKIRRCMNQVIMESISSYSEG